MNFGNPGVALFETIKSPGKTSTLERTPANLIFSFVPKINLDGCAVASAILSQGMPSWPKKS
jgi:hypothetical protein